MKNFLINLDRSPERLAQFQDANGFKRDIDRLCAVDGRALNRQALIAQGVLDAALPYSDGALGCALSHMSLWEQALETNTDTTIFEDDAVLNRHFDARSAAILEGLRGDWDCILWGWNFDTLVALDFLPGISPAVMKFDQESLRGRLDQYQSLDFDSRALPLRCAFGIMAYSVSPGGARKLLSACRPLRPFSMPLPGVARSVANHNLDVVMSAVFPQIRAFAAFPPLAVSPNVQETSLVQRKTLR
jgi:glycosyl transferase, family 25